MGYQIEGRDQQQQEADTAPAIIVIRQEVSNQSQEVSAPIERQPFQGMFIGNEIMEVAAVPQNQEPWRQST